MQIKESDVIESDWGVTLVTEKSRLLCTVCVFNTGYMVGPLTEMEKSEGKADLGSNKQNICFAENKKAH